jgi:uncharacterized protein
VNASKKNKTATKMPVKKTSTKAGKSGKPQVKAAKPTSGKPSAVPKKLDSKNKQAAIAANKKSAQTATPPKKTAVTASPKSSKAVVKVPAVKLANTKANTNLKPAKLAPATKSISSKIENEKLGKATKIAASKPAAITKAPPKAPTPKLEKAKQLPAATPSMEKKTSQSHTVAARKTEAKTVKPVAIKHEPVPPPSNTNPAIVAKIRSAQAEKELRKDLAQTAPKTSLTPLNPIPPIVKGKDRLILMVRDPYWIHAHWDIMRHSVDRAKAALAENWHTVKPILRLLKLDDSGTTSNSEVIHRDIEIHGGVRNWYIDVDAPPSRFKMLMGYLCANGRFYELARSNIVMTPAPGGKEATDDHWADIATDAEHIYSMSGGYGDDTQTGDLTEVFEERLKRTMDADVLSQFGSGAEGSLKRHKQFHFDVNAELVVFGSTHPEAHVSVGTEPVKVRSDGSFSIRLPLPDRRQVLPATAKSRDGVDEQTVVIAVERNTKVMEPVSSDTEDL